MGQEQSAPVNYLTPEDPVVYAETVHERTRPLVDFLINRFTAYLNEANNFFAIDRKRVDSEFFWYSILLNDVQVLQQRYKQELPGSLAFKLETLNLLQDMVQWKLVLAYKQRGITIGVFGGAVLLGGAAGVMIALTPVALAGAGFTSTGVAAGSWAAGVQTATTASGSLFALAQSTGVVGLSASTVAGVTVTGVAAGATAGGLRGNAVRVAVHGISDGLVPGNRDVPLDAVTLETDQSLEVETAQVDQPYQHEQLFSWEYQMSFERLWSTMLTPT